MGIGLEIEFRNITVNGVKKYKEHIFNILRGKETIAKIVTDSCVNEKMNEYYIEIVTKNVITNKKDLFRFLNVCNIIYNFCKVKNCEINNWCDEINEILYDYSTDDKKNTCNPIYKLELIQEINDNRIIFVNKKCKNSINCQANIDVKLKDIGDKKNALNETLFGISYNEMYKKIMEKSKLNCYDGAEEIIGMIILFIYQMNSMSNSKTKPFIFKTDDYSINGLKNVLDKKYNEIDDNKYIFNKHVLVKCTQAHMLQNIINNNESSKKLLQMIDWDIDDLKKMIVYNKNMNLDEYCKCFVTNIKNYLDNVSEHYYYEPNLEGMIIPESDCVVLEMRSADYNINKLISEFIGLKRDNLIQYWSDNSTCDLAVKERAKEIINHLKNTLKIEL